MLILYLALVVFCKAIYRKSYRIAGVAFVTVGYYIVFSMGFLPSLASYAGLRSIGEHALFLIMTALLVLSSEKNRR